MRFATSAKVPATSSRRCGESVLNLDQCRAQPSPGRSRYCFAPIVVIGVPLRVRALPDMRDGVISLLFIGDAEGGQSSDVNR